MRHRSQILQDAIRTTDKGVTVPQFNDKLYLLTLEVLVDIRDNLSTTTNVLISIRETLEHLP